MDQLEEYHDPDYPEASVCVKEEPPSISEEEKVDKIKSIIRREFSNELEARENEVRLIDQRMVSSRRLLHRLRYSIVSRYFSDQKLQISSAQIQDEIANQRDPRAKSEITSTLRDGQRHIHPSLRKLLGKRTVDIDEIFRSRGPRNKTRKDYSAMLQKRNYTISADSTRSLRPDVEMEEAGFSQPVPPRKVPRHMVPKATNVVTLDEATRNQIKHRYRFIIGNTSKYVPAASRLDRSTHKWLLYIRGAASAADPSPLLTAADVTLHHSYAPHHRVHLNKHPFHISRRGWGEFPAKIELHFTLPERNRPASIEHNIKLDRNYTGMQTLGSETIVDVWLYSTPEMLQYEYIEDNHTLTDTEPSTPADTEASTQEDAPKIKEENVTDTESDWMDFFKTPTELDVDEMFIKPTKQDEILLKPTQQDDIFLNSTKQETNDSMFLNSTKQETNEMFLKSKKPDELFLKPIQDDNMFLKSLTQETNNDLLLKPKKQSDTLHKTTKQDDDMFIKSTIDSIPHKTKKVKSVHQATKQNDKLLKSIKQETNDTMFLKPKKQERTKEVKIKQEIDAETDFEEKIDTDRSIQNILQVPTEILNQPASVKKRIVKYIDPTTGKIYYLEMDRELDLTKVQEIIINNTATKISPIKSNGLKSVRKKKGVSLLKPEVKHQLKAETSIKIDRIKQNFPHLENDHCYLSNPKVRCHDVKAEEVKNEVNLYDRLASVMPRFNDVRSAVNHLVRRIPLISSEARDPDFLSLFPFVVEDSERYWKLDYAKRRNIEWSRAKLINKILTEHFNGPIWRTKQILLFIRLHGHYPIRNEMPIIKTETQWPSWSNLGTDSSIKEIYPNATDITSLTVFKFDVDRSLSDTIVLSDDEDVDVLSETVKVKVRKVSEASNLQVLPVREDDDRMRFLYIEKKCADLGIELKNEDVGSGYSYSAVHAVLLSAMKSFTEEMLRSSLVEKRRQESPQSMPSVWTGSLSSETEVSLSHVFAGARRGRLRAFCNADTAALATDYCAI